MISAPQARKFWEAKMITILITLGGGGGLAYDYY